MPTLPLPIRIGFSTGKNSPISAIIRWFTKATVSHAYVVYYDPMLEDEYILEADIGGFQPMRYAQFKKHNKVVMELVPPVPLEDALKKADKWVGDYGYDYEGLFSEAIVKIAGWFGRKMKNPFHDPHSMFCSEAMTRMLQFTDWKGMDKLDPPSEDPMMLSKDMLINGAKNVYSPSDDEVTKP